jgi:hypothetical protein
MYKIKIIAKAKDHNPLIQRLEYNGEDVDLFVKQKIQELIWQHGYNEITLRINAIDAMGIQNMRIIKVTLPSIKPLTLSSVARFLVHFLNRFCDDLRK